MKIFRLPAFLYYIRSAYRRIHGFTPYVLACVRGIIKRNYKIAGLLILAIVIFSFIGFPALSSSEIRKNSGESPSGIIYATKAEILDSNKNPTKDIYKKIKEKDNNWAVVNNGEYVRVTFAEPLSVQNNILLYARKSGINPDGQNPRIEVYASDTGQLVATFPLINDKDTYKASLASLKAPTDSFNLKIINGSADIDWIVDPSYVFNLLKSFTGGASDGALPYGSLILSGSTLYGMTSQGGSSGSGTIFSIDISGSGFTLLHSFTGGASDGALPYGPLILSGSTLYGMTSSGGSSGSGTIFSINASGSGFTILHSFAGGASDGANPQKSLILSGSTLYGMTYSGGSSNDGTIFSIDVSGSGFTLLHSFAGGSSDGRNPYGGFILSGSTLYGMAENGGSSNDGIIFSLELPISPIPSNSSGKIGAITPSLDCTTNNCAWSDNAGWVNFTPTDSSGNYLGLRITDGAVIGYAWSQNYGWINFGPTPFISVTNTISGVLSGSAWGQNAGWIDFTGVFIDPDTGLFSGEATGDSDKIGTINFNTTGHSYDSESPCSPTDSTICKVVTDWKPETITFSVTNPFVNFGLFSSSGPRYATAGGAGSSSDPPDSDPPPAGILHVSIHGSSGYSISVTGSTLTNTSPSHNTISTAGTIDSVTGLLMPAASAPGTNQFGIRLIKNTGTYPGTESYVADPYATSDWALDFSELNNQVAGGDGDDTAEFGLRYICNVAPNTPAGYYLANLTFTLTPNF